MSTAAGLVGERGPDDGTTSGFAHPLTATTSPRRTSTDGVIAWSRTIAPIPKMCLRARAGLELLSLRGRSVQRLLNFGPTSHNVADICRAVGAVQNSPATFRVARGGILIGRAEFLLIRKPRPMKLPGVQGVPGWKSP